MAEEVQVEKKTAKTGEQKKSFRKPRLHSHAVILSYKRNRVNVHPNQVLVRIEGCQTREDAKHYVGKHIDYIYTCNGPKTGFKVRKISGKVIGLHGNSGVVKSKFKHNLPGQALGKRARVHMF
eukprot:Protomagalhaensia_sp_Gyna_25__874@NODE_1421_length_1851_cov_123_456402_g1146_i0_p4_GENE_NODE_1421_length_1851_cov_123_456402_g1146_i0NODE_1421_length_1851_cov_123_456402_g1146_i0_p4_ORF_typecomplete_len123_score19_69Ribosomal_L35Ae/PF01247_18/8_7e30RimM/PF01782_18/0_0042RimM/PF01782_18/2_7e02PSK/PF06404_12/1e04PSK/PF06404_12/0_24_NODE_1421_length_1851_cov_123_456402_g1146_i013891757